jgi:predicted hydrocarbon binding protein
MENAEQLKELQGLLVLMASLSHGLEATLGRGASTITFRAGRSFGTQSSTERSSTKLVEALDLLRQELSDRGIEWPFELWKPEGQADYFYEKDGKPAVKLIFRHCMVRCSLFRYGHEQRQSLCMMNHGLFCGYLQKILGQRADLEILHAGENACLKELVVSQ